jgi:pilus assembly protein Flp/PilA
MRNFLLKRYLQIKDLVDGDEGQDLVEYALVVALIALGATAGMSNLAAGISTAFNNLGIKLGTIVT